MAGHERTATAPAPVVELLVHGVGGATPAEMLDDPRTSRVTGDATASIHRRTDDRSDRPWSDGGPVREAYTWSNLTSGNGARALWLLLLPFMVVNVAHWMRPAAHGHHRTHRCYDVLVRLLALSLTVLLVAAVCALSLDLVAWQCAGSPACTEDTLPGAVTDGWWQQPGRRLALAAALPALVTALLWWLSHRTWSAYESASPPVRDRGRGPRRAALSLPGFWYGRSVVRRLRAAHTAAGLLTVASALLAATGSHDHGPHGTAVQRWGGGLLTAALLAGWLGVLVLVTRQARTETDRDQRPDPLAVRALPWGAVALLAGVVLHAAGERPGWHTAGQHPGTGVFAGLTVLQCALVVALALVARRLHTSAAPPDRGVLAGLAGPAVATLACALGGVLTAGLIQLSARWLDSALAGPPVLLAWQSAVLPPLLCVVLLFVVVGAVRVHRQARRTAPRVLARYPEEPAVRHRGRSRRVAAATARAELTDAAPALVGWVTVVSLLLGLAAVAGAQVAEEPPGTALASAPTPIAGLARAFEAAGSHLTGLGVLLLVAMGRRAYRDAAARRTVGILWDVGTFWPRAAHPFAPPCYAERAVPDLSWRIGTWIDATGGRLVLSGHSQGSVLAAAAVWQLDAPTRSRVALLTHGSPLHRLYGRWFPAYFGASALRALHRDVPCWRNLWRTTDPIGGPVRVGGAGAGPGVDRPPLRDPLCYGRNLRRPLPEPLLGHGGYTEDPAYAEERAWLYRRLSGEATEVPAQPGPREPAPGAPTG